MTRWLLAAAALAAVAAAPAAADTGIGAYNPLNGCTYSVWGPTITMHPTPDKPFAHSTSGGVGQSVQCA